MTARPPTIPPAGWPQLVADARLIGVGAAVIALALRAPILIVVFVAAVAAAAARLWGIA